MMPSEDMKSWPSREEVQSALLAAVKRVYECDSDIVNEKVHERSILFHVGRYLAETVDAWGQPWHVDLEYNKMHVGGRHKVKRVGDEDRYPDLIVHDRLSATEGNLLVVEAKKNPVCSARRADFRKLEKSQEKFRYRHAAYLE